MMLMKQRLFTDPNKNPGLAGTRDFLTIRLDQKVTMSVVPNR